MIQRIKMIGNVGQFVEAKGSHNDLRFEPLTLIYGENGRGKTMLAAILRSLATNDGDYLKELKCLWGTGEPKVTIDVSGSTAIFQDNMWSMRCDKLHVFDDHFVEANVCSHRTITLEHRRGLHKVVLGQGNVALAKRVEDLTGELRDLTRAAGDAEKDLTPHISGVMAAASFCSLAALEKVDEKIAAKEKDVEAAKAADRIKKAKGFVQIAPPDPQVGAVQTLLAKTLEDINAVAEARVRARFTALGEGAETWVESGFAFPHDETCPFCDQPIDGVAILHDFQAYFSTAYALLKAEIAEALTRIQDDMSGDALAPIVKSIAEEEAKRTFWSEFFTVDGTPFPSDRIQAAWTAVRNALVVLLKKKAASPLDVVPLDESARAAATEFEAVRKEVKAACDGLALAATEVARLQTNAAKADVAGETAALDRLKNSKARHTKAVADICDKYTEAVKSKEAKTGDKDKAVRDLSAQSKALITGYQKTINDCLGKFAAGFTIEELKASREAGNPGCVFSIGMRGHKVALGKPNAPKGTVCFRTVLSAGDRSALALAFFLAKLLDKPSLAGEIVVLDDPVSSMDCHRQDRTRDYIRQLLARGAQVIVLSHYAGFLRQVWTQTKGGSVNCIKVTCAGQASVLEHWDIAEETDTEYHKVWGRLNAYVTDPKDAADDVRASIRLVLEGYLRHHFPALMNGGERLGQFIEKARKAKADGSPKLSDARFAELESLNTFSAEKHHLSDTTEGPGPPNVAAVQAYARSALEFVAPPWP